MLDKQDLDAIQAMMQGMRISIENALEPMNNRLDRLEGSFTELRGEVTELRGEVTELRGEVTELKSDVAGLKSVVSKLDSEVTNLKGQVEELKVESRETRVMVEAQNHKIELLYEAQAETAAKFAQLDRMETTLNEVKSEVRVIRDVTRFHSGQIKEIKQVL